MGHEHGDAIRGGRAVGDVARPRPAGLDLDRADLPRGVEFLLDRNRLNVAISRARSLAVIIASPALMEISCSSVTRSQH